MITDQDRIRLYIQKVYWDLVDVCDYTRGRKSELTFVHGSILMMSTVTQLRMHDIASAFQVNPSTATDYIDYLEKHGYVRREHGNEDRRDVFVVPTEKGRTVVNEIKQKTFDYVDMHIERLTPEERRQFLVLLSKFIGDPGYPHFIKLLKTRSKQD